MASIQANAPGAGHEWERAAFVLVLGLPLSFALSVLAEERHWAGFPRVGPQLLGLGMLGGFYLVWPGMRADVDAVRYFQLSAVLHLGTSFLPFLRGRERPGFWQYNNLLFTGALRAALFAQVLFVGVAIALASLERLFGVDLPDRTYVNVMFVVGLVVMTWIFLAAVPEDVTALDDAVTYPRPLKVFAQYILTPLALAYLLILLAYLVKIVAIAEWPSGWIGWLVASVSVTGLLGFLLVHPLRSSPGEGWIRVYSRWLFIGLIPAAAMLIVAFWKRIVPYGLTEPRVIGLLLGCWLFGIAIYFAGRREAGIRTIPITLALLLAVTLFGPFSLTHLSVNSQRDRLVAMLAVADNPELRDREASGALRFLLERRDTAAAAAALGTPITLGPRSGTYGVANVDSIATVALARHGVRYRAQWYAGGADQDRYFSREHGSATDVAGYTWLIAISPADTMRRVVGEDSVYVVPTLDSMVTHIVVGTDTLRFDLGEFARHAVSVEPPWRELPAAESRLTAAGPRRATLVVTSLIVRGSADSVRVRSWNGELLIAPRP